MRRLVLVAAGGLAREVLEAVRAAAPRREIRVLDDDPSRHGTLLHDVPIIGGLDVVTALDDVDVVVCAGHGSVRRRLVERLLALGVPPGRFATVVHPAARIPASGTIGAGSILLAGVVLTSDVRIGRHVVVMPQATLTHDVEVDDFATICAGVSLGGSVSIGAAAYLGMNACVRQGLRVGADATLGMAAALTKDLPPGETWTGVPARRTTPTMRQAS